MANVTDHANVAAAVAAGFKSTAEDRGATANPRFRRYLEKNLSGAAGDGDGITIRGIGESNVDQATADAQALAAVNAQRRHYYGGSPGRASGSPQSAAGRGGTHTIDTT